MTTTKLHNMDQNNINKLYQNGAFLVVQDVPLNTEFGIDYSSWSTGAKFGGLKMIPPGVHFVFYSAVSKQGGVAPRIGFFHDFKPQEILVKRYDPRTEVLNSSEDDISLEQIKSMDTSLAPYPYEHYQRWCSLTTHVTMETVQRVQPPCISIHSAAPLLHNPNSSRDVENASSLEDKLDANFIQDDTKAMRFIKIDTKKDMKGLSGSEITNFFMDSSSHVEKLVEQTGSENELLGELEIAFVVFLLGHVYSSFEHWKNLVNLFCRARQSLHDRPCLYKNFIRTLHFNLKETPDDFFVDIVSKNNFLTTTLTIFFETFREEKELDKELVERADKFKAHLERKYDWDFDYDEDDVPVVVAI